MEQLKLLTSEYAMLPPGATILCAVSGGSDSMCLLHYLTTHASAGGYRVSAAHFNHHLRGEESDRDAAFVARWCGENAVPLENGGGDVLSQAKAEGRGVEETARALRYAFLESAADKLGADSIATAHNADDNAETLLLHLVRGSGLQGLTGIPPRRGRLIRPLLTTPRSEIESYLEAHRVPHVEDSTNADTAYARNRLRHDVLPVLRALNPNLTARLSATVAALRADNDYLNAQAAQALSALQRVDDDLVLPAAHLARAPDPIAMRMVQQLLRARGDGAGKCTAEHLKSVVALARSDDPSGLVFLPNGLLAQRVYRDLLLTALPPECPLPELPLPPNGAYEGGGWRISCRQAVCREQPKRPEHFFLSAAAIRGGIVVRGRKIGDAITLPLRDRKTLQKLMLDEKIPRRARDSVPVLADETGPLAVAGLGPDMPHLAGPNEAAYEIEISKL